MALDLYHVDNSRTGSSLNNINNHPQEQTSGRELNNSLSRRTSYPNHCHYRCYGSPRHRPYHSHHRSLPVVSLQAGPSSQPSAQLKNPHQALKSHPHSKNHQQPVGFQL